MKINGIEIDASKGFDCVRGKTTCVHFATYSAAKAYQAQYPKTVIHYYAKKEG